MSNFFLSKTNTFIKSITLFDTIEYKSEYKGDHLFFFSLPLLMNISQIFNDIKKITFNKKVISIISVLIFHEKDSDNKYIHSLSESNKLYSLEDFDKWPDIVLSNIIEKLELYNSFKKISFNVKVKIITNV
jgi:hypothetical protein